MKSQILYALAHPVFEPDRDIRAGHYWQLGKTSFCLTVNIGME